MALLDIFPPGGGSLIGNVILDATLSEMHRKTNNITSHPIEEGANVTDHIQQLPDEIELVGMVSDFPVYWGASLTARSPIVNDPELGRVFRSKKAYLELERIMADGELVDVVTTFKTYENMAITSLTVPKDAGSGNDARMTISLKEVVRVESKEVAAPEPETGADASPVKRGKVTPKDAATESPGTETKANTLADSFAGIFLD